jgi:hypothetical protein
MLVTLASAHENHSVEIVILRQESEKYMEVRNFDQLCTKYKTVDVMFNGKSIMKSPTVLKFLGQTSNKLQTYISICVCSQ